MKYQNHTPRPTQIPRSSILALIKHLDRNNDGLIDVGDLVTFTQKNFLYYSTELA
jgi:Ca2+-binding EF-hand superfamily protein